MNGTYWVKHSVLAVVVAVALAAPVGAAPPDAWITTKTKLSLLTTEGVSGTAIHVDTILGKVPCTARRVPLRRRRKRRASPKRSTACWRWQPFAGRYPTAREGSAAVR